MTRDLKRIATSMTTTKENKENIVARKSKGRAVGEATTPAIQSVVRVCSEPPHLWSLSSGRRVGEEDLCHWTPRTFSFIPAVAITGVLHNWKH